MSSTLYVSFVSQFYDDELVRGSRNIFQGTTADTHWYKTELRRLVTMSSVCVCVNSPFFGSMRSNPCLPSSSSSGYIRSFSGETRREECRKSLSSLDSGKRRAVRLGKYNTVCVLRGRRETRRTRCREIDAIFFPLVFSTETHNLISLRHSLSSHPSLESASLPACPLHSIP